MTASPAQPESDSLRRLCESLQSRAEDIGDEITDQVRREIPSYAALPLPEHRRTVREQFRALLRGLALGVEPTAEQLMAVQVASRRRAYHGLPVHDVLAAFHIVARRLWDDLRAAAQGTPAEDSVIELVAPLWSWIESMSGVAADAYAEEAGTRHGHEAGQRQRFLELLRSGGAAREQTAEIARELGFDPDSTFRAVCTPAEVWVVQGRLDLLQRATRQVTGTVSCGLRGQLMIAIAQQLDPSDLVTRVTSLGGEDVRVGVGLDRAGLAGAEMSIGDAERALVVAERGGSATPFEDVWLQASLIDSRERLHPLFTAVRETAAEQKHLAETVIAFADGGLSLVNAAEALMIHPNTVAYRLGQWHKLTGSDPRTFAGLVRSVIGITT